MLNSKVKVMVISLIILFIFISLIVTTSAFEKEDEGWNISITNGTKDLLKNTEDIAFEIENNPNIVKGKFAPGNIAKAKVDLNIIGTKLPIDFSIDINDEILKENNIDLIIKLDDKEINNGEIIVLNPINNKEFTKIDGYKNILLELKWNESNMDSFIEHNGNIINFPIKFKVDQHID